MINVKRMSHATFETPDLDRQIDYFTQTAGLALAERENGRAFLATKLGDLAVQLEKGEHARCSRLAFQVAPETEFDDIRRGIEAEGMRCQTRNDPTPESRARGCRTRHTPSVPEPRRQDGRA